MLQELPCIFHFFKSPQTTPPKNINKCVISVYHFYYEIPQKHVKSVVENHDTNPFLKMQGGFLDLAIFRPFSKKRTFFNCKNLFWKSSNSAVHFRKKIEKNEKSEPKNRELSKNEKNLHGNPVTKKNASYGVLSRFFSCFSEKLLNSAVPFFLKSWKTAKKGYRIPMLWKKMKNKKRVFCVFLKRDRDTNPLFSNFLKIKKTQKWKKHAFFAFFSDFLSKIGT